MTIRRFTLLLILLALASCADGPAAPILLHLDPRLADGRSPAAALAASRRVVDSCSFDGSIEAQAPWRLENAKTQPVENGDGMLLIQAETGGRALRLVHEGTYHAGPGRALEIEVLRRNSLALRLCWRRGKEAPRHVEVFMPGADDYRTLIFFPAFDPQWSGKVTELWLEPKWQQRKERRTFQVREIRFIEMGYPPDYAALEEESGDGGMVVLGREAHRAWPADMGVPLHAQCVVPKEGRFLASVAVLPNYKASCVRFVLEAREPGAEWKRIAEKTVEPANGWCGFNADLSSFSERKIELRMVALNEGAEPGDGRKPVQCTCLWGEPVVIGRKAGPSKPNILLVTLDTTRSDHVGDETRTPCLARMGEGGIVFENAWSGCNSTIPSHASILTGVRIFEHGALNNRSNLPSSNVTLAERLRRAGYHTAAAVSIPMLQADRGFGQGFDRFLIPDDACPLDGKGTLEPVIDWIRDWGGKGERPFFLWFHLYDPHVPYGPPEAFRKTFADRRGKGTPSPEADPPTLPVFDSENLVHRRWLDDISNRTYVEFLYSASVSYTDHLMDELLDVVEGQRLLDNTFVLVTADHGESLGEHRIWYQHMGLFEESLRVPLIMKVPGGPAGVRVESPVSTLDIAPTLLKLCGLEPEPGMSGEDLLSIAREGGDPGRRLWFENAGLKQIATRDPHCHFIYTAKDTVRYLEEGNRKQEGRALEKPEVISKNSVFLYKIKEDPGLERNLAAEESEMVKSYLELMKLWQESLEEGEVTKRRLSEEEEARLRALGYVGD